MRDEWKHDGFIENTLYRINFQAQNGFTLSTKGGARLEIRSGETTRGLYHVGSWLVETAGGQWDGMVELGLKGSLPACEKPLEALSVLIPGGTAALKFCLLKNSEVSRTYNAVRSFTIYANRTVVFNMEAGSPTAGAEGLSHGVPIGQGQPSQEQALHAALAQAKKEQEQANARLAEQEASRRALERSLFEANEALNTERLRNAGLEKAVSCRLDQLLEMLSSHRKDLSQGMEEKLQEIEKASQALEQETAEAQKRAARAEAELAELKAELNRAKNLEEIQSLDCQHAECELAELREQLEDDKDTLELMREEPFFNGKTLGALMEETWEKLETMEMRLGQIIFLREKINQSVQQAILQKDGTLALEHELGGLEDGGGSQAQNSGIGEGTYRA